MMPVSRKSSYVAASLLCCHLAISAQPCRSQQLVAVPKDFLSATSVVQAAEPTSTVSAHLTNMVALPVTAEEALAGNVQSILLNAKSELNIDSLPKLDMARSELAQAVQELESYVGLASANGGAWSEFLRLDELRAEMEVEQPDIDKLSELEMNMKQNYAGLEYAPFVRVRTKLAQFLYAARFGSNPEGTIELLGKRIDQLVEDLNEPEDDSGLVRSRMIGVIANYLHESRQAPSAVAALHSLYSRPNVRVHAQEALLNRVLARHVAEPNPVDECILGTRILGQACVLGSVSADVVPMLQGVSMKLNLMATMTSQNKGYNRGVVLNTTGTSPIYASKQIFVTPNRISSSPAVVSTNLQSSIQSIEHQLRIVRRIAAKKAAQQKPLADSIAQGRLQSRTQARYDQQVSEQLAEANSQLSTFGQGSRPEVLRVGFPRPALVIYSTDTSVHGDVTQAAAFQLASAESCKIPQPANADLVIEAHQSAVINSLDSLLGGRTIYSENFDEYAQQILGKVPDGIRQEVQGEPFSVSFAAFHPIEVEFDEGLIKISLRISKMTRGDQTLDSAAIATAAYQPSIVAGKLELRRQGEVAIDFPGGSRGSRAITLRSFLKKKFDETFREEIVIDGMNLRNRFPKAPNMSIQNLQLEDGWMQASFK